MRRNTFWISYLLLLMGQLIISNFFHVTPYLLLSFLPAMVLCISIRINRIWVLLIAFASGLLVDWLSEGVLGLNALALVPVAFSRDFIIHLIFGEELYARQEDFSVQSHGVPKLIMALIMAQSLFLLIYIWVDGAGMRPLLFNLYRFLASLGAGVLISLPILNVLTKERRK